MHVMRTVLLLLTLSALCTDAIGVAQAQVNPQQVTVPLSDPSRPGTLTMNLRLGGVTIRGTARKDVLIEALSSEQARDSRRSRGGSDSDSAGLRRLTPAGGFVIDESNNQVLVISGGRSSRTDFTIQVPTRTNLKLSALNDGPIVVENVEGEIEVHNQNDSITLTNVAGTVMANAHNGRVKVIVTRLTADKAMAFTAFNGPVDVTLPASAKANLKMRSDRGEIFTDFDVQIRANTAAAQSARDGNGRVRIAVNRSIEGSVNGGGPEFEFRTFSGNIYVRKGAQ